MTTTGTNLTTDDEPRATAPVRGGSLFAGAVIATVGGFQVLQGLSAALEDDIFVTGTQYVYELDVSTWGWVTMIVGAILVAVGIGILKGSEVAAFAGIGLAILSALGQFAFMPYYPFWAILIIVMDVLVIWALTNQIKAVDAAGR